MSNEGNVCHLDKDYYRLVDHLSKLPHKILQYHHLDSLPQIILYELGNVNGFGLTRAVYLVDNPDFDHLVGAAGFYCDECCDEGNCWQSVDSFSEKIKEDRFNSKIKNIVRQSLKRQDLDLSESEDIRDLSKTMGFEDPKIFSWNMKHGNHGILIFEHADEMPEERLNLLKNAAALLSLCGL